MQVTQMKTPQKSKRKSLKVLFPAPFSTLIDFCVLHHTPGRDHFRKGCWREIICLREREEKKETDRTRIKKKKELTPKFIDV